MSPIYDQNHKKEISQNFLTFNRKVSNGVFHQSVFFKSELKKFNEGIAAQIQFRLNQRVVS